MTTVDSILAVHPGALGDVVLFGRLLQRLEAPVTLIAGGQKATLLRELGIVEVALDFDTLPMQELFARTPLQHGRLAGLLGEHRRLISCLGEGDALAGRRLADMCRCESASFLPVRSPEGAEVHLLDIWADLLGLPAFDLEAPAPAAAERLAAAGRTALARAGHHAGRFVALAPGSGSEVKNWPLECYRRLAGHLRDEHAMARVWVLGPVELDRWGETTAERLKADGAVLVCPTPAELAGVLSLASAVVGNDSGTSHLAAMVGTATVALFGPTSARQFRPVGPRVRVIDRASLDRITAAMVLEAMKTENIL
ncbi:MAG: glycosyltransferase family 9 protein [Phycisphaerae bacterium]